MCELIVSVISVAANRVIRRRARSRAETDRLLDDRRHKHRADHT